MEPSDSLAELGSVRATSVPRFMPVLYAATPSASARTIAAAKGIHISRHGICEGRYVNRFPVFALSKASYSVRLDPLSCCSLSRRLKNAASAFSTDQD